MSEPTSTIVLTSQSNYFVDIRILKSVSIPSALEAPSKSPLPVSRLDWAFGGIASSTTHARRQSASAASNSSGKKEKLKELSSIEATSETAPNHKRNKSGPTTTNSNYRQTTWSHWVDSRHAKASPIASIAPPTPDLSSTQQGDWVDSGTIHPTEKDNESLEKGRMINPETLLMTEYEELWKDLPIQKLAHEPGLLSFVLKAENTALGTRGLIARVGSWCQGVIRSGTDLSVERWRFGGIAAGGSAGLVDEPGVNDGISNQKWERLAKIGEMSLPCQVCWEKGWELQVGEEVVSGGLKWEVVEKYVWK